MMRASRSPGPNQYSIPSTLANSGGRFSLSDELLKMLRAAETPGPGQYKLPEFGSGKGGVKISDKTR